MDRSEFAKAILNKNLETFVVYIIILVVETLIHLSQIAQIVAL